MSSVDQAIQNQLENIQKRSGKSLPQLEAFVRKSGLSKHGEIRDLLKRELGMGHGDANLIATHYLKAGAGPASGAPDGDGLDEIYSGAKSELRPIHESIMSAIAKLGEFEIAPKKGYVSLRRKKQFAMLGPGTKGRVELGLNMKGIAATERLIAQPAGGMCQYKVFLTKKSEVDRELIGWIKTAFDTAGS